MKNHSLAIGLLVLAFVLILLGFYFQYPMNMEINTLKAQVLERESEIRELNGEINSLNQKVSSWQTTLQETNNQLNARMADIEKKIS